MSAPLARRLSAEALGSFLLFATVIGSGIMAERLAGGNIAVALLANTMATGAILFVLITMLGPIWGAHMNPAVSLVAAVRRDLAWRDAAAYLIVQIALSTSFANPAITIARSLSDSFAGIAPRDVPTFIAAQLVGAALGAVVSRTLFAADTK